MSYIESKQQLATGIAADKTEFEEAERAIRFINKLKRTKDNRNETFNLRPWQADIIRGLLRVDPATGKRQIQNAYISFGRKQGKSQLIAALCCYFMFGSGRHGQAVYVGAAKRDQALLIWEMVADFIKASPTLKKLATLQPYKYRIAWEDKRNQLISLSCEGAKNEGIGPSIAIIDELHAHKDGRLWDSLTSSMGGTQEPLVITITTAPEGTEGKCYEQYTYAKKCLDDPTFDPSFYACVHECPTDVDWRDEKNWYLAMPALGDFCNLDPIRAKFRQAQELPSEERTFRNKYLNQIVSKYVESWLPMKHWKQCGKPDPTTHGKEKWYGGLDLASVSDFTSFVLYSPTSHTLLPFFFLPEEAAKDKPHYQIWAKRKLLTLTEGNATDYDVVRAKINELAEQYHIEKIAVDRVFNSVHISTQLTQDGFQLEAYGQGFLSMSPACKELERLVLTHQLRFDHPILDWMAGNAVVEEDAAGNIKITKRKSKDKVDAISASLMALGVTLPKPDKNIIHGKAMMWI